jgi:4-diphosphocytidyl-2-C-methyl-D-erythritol kinase
VRQRVRGTGAWKPASNDLERAVAPIHPHLRRLLQKLWAAGATAAAMTGSGSAVYGFFAGERQATRALRFLTEPSTLARAWLGRTVGAAEYAARLLSP